MSWSWVSFFCGMGVMGVLVPITTAIFLAFWDWFMNKYDK